VLVGMSSWAVEAVASGAPGLRVSYELQGSDSDASHAEEKTNAGCQLRLGLCCGLGYPLQRCICMLLCFRVCACLRCASLQ
jgi:hypothetical protein